MNHEFQKVVAIAVGERAQLRAYGAMKSKINLTDHVLCYGMYNVAVMIAT